jgi:hypothetical protein
LGSIFCEECGYCSFAKLFENNILGFLKEKSLAPDNLQSQGFQYFTGKILNHKDFLWIFPQGDDSNRPRRGRGYPTGNLFNFSSGLGPEAL